MNPLLKKQLNGDNIILLLNLLIINIVIPYLLRDIYAVLFKVIEQLCVGLHNFKDSKILLTIFVSKSENFRDFRMISLVSPFYKHYI